MSKPPAAVHYTGTGITRTSLIASSRFRMTEQSLRTPAASHETSGGSRLGTTRKSIPHHLGYGITYSCDCLQGRISWRLPTSEIKRNIGRSSQQAFPVRLFFAQTIESKNKANKVPNPSNRQVPLLCYWVTQRTRIHIDYLKQVEVIRIVSMVKYDIATCVNMCVREL